MTKGKNRCYRICHNAAAEPRDRISEKYGSPDDLDPCIDYLEVYAGVPVVEVEMGVHEQLNINNSK